MLKQPLEQKWAPCLYVPQALSDALECCLRAVWPGLSVSVDGSTLMYHLCYSYKLREGRSEQENTLGCWLSFPRIPLIHSSHYGDFDLPSEDTTSQCTLTLRSVTPRVRILKHAWMIMFVISEWNQRLVVSSKAAVAGINEKRWHHRSVFPKSNADLNQRNTSVIHGLYLGKGARTSMSLSHYQKEHFSAGPDNLQMV